MNEAYRLHHRTDGFFSKRRRRSTNQNYTNMIKYGNIFTLKESIFSASLSVYYNIATIRISVSSFNWTRSIFSYSINSTPKQHWKSFILITQTWCFGFNNKIQYPNSLCMIFVNNSYQKLHSFQSMYPVISCLSQGYANIFRYVYEFNSQYVHLRILSDAVL